MKLDSPNDSLVTEYKNKLFDLKREQEIFIQTLKEKYPDYYQLKYDHTVIDIEQNSRNTKGPIKLYWNIFVGKHRIFIFVIGKERFEAREVKIDFPLDSLVKNLRKGIYEYWMMPDLSQLGYKENQDRYIHAAYQLYEKLIEPVSSLLPEKLTIVPDGVLNLLPFEALLTKRPSQSNYGKITIYDQNPSDQL